MSEQIPEDDDISILKQRGRPILYRTEEEKRMSRHVYYLKHRDEYLERSRNSRRYLLNYIAELENKIKELEDIKPLKITI